MYKRYERYKDSGVEWIGEIPEHWEMVTLKRKYKVVNGGTPKSEESTFWDDGNIIWVTPDDLSRNQGKYIYDSKRRITDKGLKNSSASLVHLNSLVVSTRAPIGYVKIAGNKISTNQGCKSLVPRVRDIDEVYYYYSLIFKKNYLNVMGQGTTFTELSNYNLANCPASLPPYSEQKAVSTYLSKVDSEIDSLIADKEELIKKLEEYKQSIITEAVTKGLNPDFKMKDSGVEWIGDIPEHWDVVKIKHLLKNHKNAIKVGPFGSQLTADEMTNGEIKVYNQRNVYNKDYSVGENFISIDKYKSLKGFRVYPEDILFTTRGTIGQAYVIPKESELGVLHPCLMRIQVKSDLINKYFIEEVFNETKIATNQIFYESNSTTIEVIYSETLKNLVLPLPDVNEQEIILEKNKEFKIACNTLIKNVQTQIENLKSYRQSLIFEAVTGKIDVRDYQPERSEQLA